MPTATSRLRPPSGRRISIALVTIALTAVVSGRPGRAVARSADPDLDDLLRRTGQYVQQFERDFALIVSDESYSQQDRIASRRPRSRTMQAEVFFTWIAEDASWISVRNVLAVDGMPVAHSRESLERAAASASGGGAGRSELQRLREAGARFNLGFIQRTFNDPMFALQVIDPRFQSRFMFKLAGSEIVEGVDAWRIAWTEHERKTLIVDRDGADLFSTGTTWISRAGPVVLKTQLVVDDRKRRTRGEIVVTYRHEPHLGLWLPGRMEEHYLQRRNPSIPSIFREQIDCVATYANFRRFETSGRLITPH